MKLFFFLSGEHRSLPAAEVLAVLETLDLDFRVEDASVQILVIGVRGSRSKMEEAGKRLALSHCICEFTGSCTADMESILQMVGSGEIELGRSYAVRVRRMGRCSSDLSSSVLEKEIGRALSGRGSKVDLENPETVVYSVLGERFVYGRRQVEIDRGAFEERRPHLRPYFHPSSMLPRLARAVVNLSRTKNGSKVIDPFCGTGGLLIEAGLVGAEVFGADVDSDMISGCRKNLKHVGIEAATLLERDFRDLGRDFESYFDALITDPPYGKSSTTKGLKLEELYQDGFQVFWTLLKPGGHACVVGPAECGIEKFATGEGFEVRERHLVRIHRSLTREVLVLRR